MTATVSAGAEAGPRTILITGCSSGIGAASARLMRGRNWRVFPAARKPEDVEALAAQGFDAVLIDYERPETIRSGLEIVLAKTGGRLDALFNNGAYAVPCAVEDLPVEALRALFEANFFGWHDLTRQVIPVMRAQGAGRIVQCSSILGFIAMKYRGAYTASKFALEAYSDTLRQELHGTGIHVSLIEPGPIGTRFTENALANFHHWIGREGMIASPHRATYERRLKRMENGEPGPWKLPPEAVVEKLIHAAEASRPRPRYRVTKPTIWMNIVRRLLTTRALDRVLLKAADGEE
jgi:NAD(P)-dependent dehydrogenase (short-subunit alcohol dehydrogenase family)